MIDFVLPKRERKSKRPYGLTHLQVEMLQRLADGDRYAQMTTSARDERCVWNMAYQIRIKMGASTNAEATAIGLREGIIK